MLICNKPLHANLNSNACELCGFANIAIILVSELRTHQFIAMAIELCQSEIPMVMIYISYIMVYYLTYFQK
jgi:hypothetical protein